MPTSDNPFQLSSPPAPVNKPVHQAKASRHQTPLPAYQSENQSSTANQNPFAAAEIENRSSFQPASLQQGSNTTAVITTHSPSSPHTHLDVVDTQTLDGLAIHLQSPRLRRQYWFQHYQGDYDTLSRVAGVEEELTVFLQAHQCPGLVRTLQQDMVRHARLTQLYTTLYQQEDAQLSPLERQGQAVWLRGKHVFVAMKAALKELAFPSLGYSAPEGVNGEANASVLKNTEVGIFRAWLNYLSSRQSRQGLPPQLLQELYHIRHQLF